MTALASSTPVRTTVTWCSTAMNSKGRRSDEVTIVKYSAQRRSRHRPTPSSVNTEAYTRETMPSCRQRKAGTPLTCASASCSRCSEKPTGRLCAHSCIAASTCGFMRRHATIAERTDSAALTNLYIAIAARAGLCGRSLGDVTLGRSSKVPQGSFLYAELLILAHRVLTGQGDPLRALSMAAAALQNEQPANETENPHEER